MSLRRSRSESEIINRRTDNGDYGLVMKSNNEDKTFARPDKVSLFGPPVGIFSGPDENKAHTLDMEKIGPQCEERNPRLCGACGGMHEFWACPLRTMCKFDQEVPEDYEVVCACSDCFCPGRCAFPFGRVRLKRPDMAFKFF